MTDQIISSRPAADVKRRPITPGAREVDLTREVDYGGDVGVQVETYARQIVVDAYPPGSAVPVAVTEKAYANIYAAAGWTLKPNGNGSGPLAGDDTAAMSRLLDDEEAERLASELEESRRAQERAEAEAAVLRAELEAARAEQPTTEAAKAAGKAGK